MAFEQLRRIAQRLAGSHPGGASPWRAPVRLDRGPLGEAGLALDGHGRGAALWENGGEVWSLTVGPQAAPAMARLPLGTGTRPRLIMNPEGRGTALWQDRKGVEVQLLGRPVGAEGGGTQVLYRSRVPLEEVQAVVDRRGNALVVWLQADDAGGVVLAQGFDMRRATWEAAPVELGRTGVEGRSVRLAANHREHAMVLWTEADDTGDRLVASHYWPKDRIWSDRPMSVVTRATTQHRVAMDDQGNALALWVHAPYGQRASLEASFYDIHRCEWGEPCLLSQADVLTVPELVMNGAGQALAAWCQSEGHGASRLLVKPFAQGRWGAAAECLELGHEPVQALSLDLDAEGRACLLAIHRGASGTWVSARLREGAWGEAFALASPSPAPCAHPLVRLCPAGASALWLQGVGRDRALHLAETR